MTAPDASLAADVAVLPCPFCGGGTTEIKANPGVWRGVQGYGEPVSYEVNHWCVAVEGQPSRHLIRFVGRDEASAVAKWNTRAIAALSPAAGSDGAWPPIETQAAQDVLAERARQVSVEGWTPEHDDAHDGEQMAAAASVYAAPYGYDVAVVWPWDLASYKPGPRRRELVKAAALILAEIERLDRSGNRVLAEMERLLQPPLGTDDPANIMERRQDCLIPIASDARKGKDPCGECHLRAGETCDICGASLPAAPGSAP